MVRFPLNSNIKPKILTDFTKLYVLSLEKLNQLEEYMLLPSWYNSIAQLFTSPNECIHSIRMYPFDVLNTFTFSYIAQENIRLGGVYVKSGVDNYIPTWTILDNGELFKLRVNVGHIVIRKNELYGSFLDLENIYRLYLPYLETITLDTEQVTPIDEAYVEIYVDYVVNILTGGLTAYVYRYDAYGNIITLNIVNGTIGIEIPLNTSTASNVANDVMISMLKFGLSGGTNVSSLLTDTQVHFNQIGGYSEGLAKMFGVQEVHLIIERPIKNEATNYAKLNGKPCDAYYPLSMLHGYTEISSIELDDIGSITNVEKKELENLLKTGVYF